MSDLFIPPVLPEQRGLQLPKGACDSHNHVFGDPNIFPMIYPPGFPLPYATEDLYGRMLDNLGLDRGVLVQTTYQGCDASLLIEALNAGNGRYRGVGAAEKTVSDDTLSEMNEAGVRGLRFVEARSPAGAPRPGSVSFEHIPELASRMKDLGWSVNVWAKLAVLVNHFDTILAADLPVVVEHMGMLQPGLGVSHPDFQRLLGLLKENRIWIKLSFCRCSQCPPDYEDLKPFVEALIEANEDQLIWGSDWPHVRMQGEEPDVGHLLELVTKWIGDQSVVNKILAENPARLFNFEN